MISLNIISLQKKKRLGNRTHPCLRLCFICSQFLTYLPFYWLLLVSGIYMFYYSETYPVNHNILQHCIYFMIHMIKSFCVIYKTKLQVFLCLSWSLHLCLQCIYCVISFIPIVKTHTAVHKIPSLHLSIYLPFTSVNIPSCLLTCLFILHEKL